MKTLGELKWCLLLFAVFFFLNACSAADAGSWKKDTPLTSKPDMAAADSCFWDCLKVAEVRSTDKEGIKYYFGIYFESKSCGNSFLTKLDGKFGNRQKLISFYEPVWHVSKLDGLNERELFIQCSSYEYQSPTSGLRYDHISLNFFDIEGEPILKTKAQAKLYAKYFQGVLDGLGCPANGRGTETAW